MENDRKRIIEGTHARPLPDTGHIQRIQPQFFEKVRLVAALSKKYKYQHQANHKAT
jgi:hypothetical protein